MQVIDSWFERVQSFLQKIGIADREDLPSRLWNCDETGFCTAVASRVVLARRGSRAVHETGGGSGRDYITVLGCGAADGNRLPPYTVYQGQNQYARWISGGPPGALYGMSKSGWMESANFLSWFEKMLLPAVEPLLAEAPVVLFVDGHHSHLSLPLLCRAHEKGVHLMCLPPHTTHILQPLDVGVYGPVKKAWQGIVKTYKTQTLGANISKGDFPGKQSNLYLNKLKTHLFLLILRLAQAVVGGII